MKKPSKPEFLKNCDTVSLKGQCRTSRTLYHQQHPVPTFNYITLHYLLQHLAFPGETFCIRFYTESTVLHHASILWICSTCCTNLSCAAWVSKDNNFTIFQAPCIKKLDFHNFRHTGSRAAPLHLVKEVQPSAPSDG
jgi:hypothetical protein